MSGETGHDDYRELAEFSVRAVLLGIVVGILFGAANAYLGLKVGLTVSASIPAAVMSISLFRALGRTRLFAPATILENNMVQTIGSAGESLAAGIIFTVPALILLGLSPGILKIFVLGSIGGVLGVLFMIPLRRYLIVREHGKLVYPEGTACASVLEAGQEGGTKGWLVFAGLGLGGLYEYLVSGAGVLKETPKWLIPRFPSAEVSANSSAALLGVGYIIGPRIAAIMFGGGALAWLVFIPAIKLFAGSSASLIYPSPVPVAELDAHGIWNYYVRYIGAGAVVFGGVVTLVRSLPVILSSGLAVLKNLGAKGQGSAVADRAQKDLPGSFIAAGVLALCLAMIFLPKSLVPGNWVSAVLAVSFAFFFVAVSSRIVGLIGSSSNPISGMTIAALLATSLVFKALGWTDSAGQAAALGVGAIVCISAAIAGDVSQDLKTGYLVRATPRLQQIGEIVGVLTSAAVIGIVVLRLHQAFGIGSEKLPAPQATLMSLVVKGVLSGDLPWTLVLIGISAAAVVEVVGIPSLPFAVGFYLPLYMTTPIMLGGLVRAVAQRRLAARGKGAGGPDAEAAPDGSPENACRETVCERGVLYASGLIAGSAFLGMVLGLARSFGAESLPGRFMEFIHHGPQWAGAWQDPVAALALIAAAVMLFAIGKGRLEA
ncbi:MAG TPA: oligopeptide transporter, OPT family [bacterium]|nr:oligopeptide transporter, OPT family [bacterium]